MEVALFLKKVPFTQMFSEGLFLFFDPFGLLPPSVLLRFEFLTAVEGHRLDASSVSKCVVI